jgi:hypothetical protein
VNIRNVAIRLALVIAVASGSALHAGTLGPVCGSCYGSTYTLDNLGVASSTATTETWRIKYTINTNGYDFSPADYISSVAVKVGSPITASLESTTAPGTWTVHLQGLSNNDCQGGADVWVCAEDGTTAVANGSTYTWTFLVKLAKGGLFDDVNEAGIKANYESLTANVGRVVSESITLGSPTGGEVPEPAALSLLIGGLGVWMWSRRRAVS